MMTKAFPSCKHHGGVPEQATRAPLALSSTQALDNLLAHEELGPLGQAEVEPSRLSESFRGVSVRFGPIYSGKKASKKAFLFDSMLFEWKSFSPGPKSNSRCSSLATRASSKSGRSVRGALSSILFGKQL